MELGHDLPDLIARVRSKPDDAGELTQLRLALHRAALQAREKKDPRRQFACGLLGDALLFTSQIGVGLIAVVERGVAIVVSAEAVTNEHLRDLRRGLVFAGASLTARDM